MSNVAFSMDPLIPKMDQKLIKAASAKPALLRGVLKTVAESVMEFIISRWPVDTATSLAGWGVRRGGQSWEVYNPVEYTSYVHEGLAEQLYKQALGRAVSPANALLRSRVSRAASPAGTRQRRTVTPQSLRRIGRSATKAARSAVTKDRAVVRAARSLVSSWTPRATLTQALITQTQQLVRAGKIEAAIRLLVRNGRRGEARKLSKLLQPADASFGGSVDPTRI